MGIVSMIPNASKRYNAKPGNKQSSQARGNKYYRDNPEVNRLRVALRRAEKGNQCTGIYAQMIEEARDPITIESDNIAITSDWHLPFVDEKLLNILFAAAEENGTKELIVAGDFWDLDNYSRFLSYTEGAVTATKTFEGEVEEVKKMLARIFNVFEKVYFCRGNHEKRLLDLNAGKLNIKHLFALARPSNLSEDAWNERVRITSDDHINLISQGQLWLCCHPRNFRITPLSVARDLSAKHLCNVIVAHGHSFNQGRDRSGLFRVCDGGGLFERGALEYTRETSCYPQTRNGFFILKENVLLPFEGEA